MTTKINTNFILAGVAIAGAYLYMSTRQRAASKATPQAVNRQFFQSPAAQVGTGPSPAAGNSLLDFGLGLANRALSAFNQPIIRPPGFTPGYFPDNAGEGAALDYYATHADQFAANTPLAYVTNTGGGGGWADSQ